VVLLVDFRFAGRFAGFFLGALDSSVASVAGAMLAGDKSSRSSVSKGLLRARLRRVASAAK
jgi:hypothetical protein